MVYVETLLEHIAHVLVKNTFGLWILSLIDAYVLVNATFVHLYVGDWLMQRPFHNLAIGGCLTRKKSHTERISTEHGLLPSQRRADAFAMKYVLELIQSDVCHSFVQKRQTKRSLVRIEHRINPGT